MLDAPYEHDSSSTARILAVEDEPVIGEAIVAALEIEFGVEVDLAADGATALSLTSQRSYDLVILDWSLPPPTGLELLKHWRQRKMVGRVIMLTAWSEKSIRDSALENGADDFLTKPFCIDELRLCARKQLLHVIKH
jgi:two-component system response regulator VanR